MSRVVVTVIVAALALAGCTPPPELVEQARSAADDARSAVEEAAGGADGARERLDDLAARADEIGARLTWCGAAVRLGTAVAARDVDAAEVAFEDLRATAPMTIAEEVRIVGEAVGRAQLGQPQVLLEPEVQQAAFVVLDEARESCGIGGG